MKVWAILCILSMLDMLFILFYTNYLELVKYIPVVEEESYLLNVFIISHVNIVLGKFYITDCF